MKTKNKLQKVIYKLAIEKGYPHIKLDFYTYQQVLKEAHRRIFQSKQQGGKP